jgi:hypothetical protein
MLKIVEENGKRNDRIVEMKDMKPLQVGIVVDDLKYKGHFVMRSQAVEHVEIIDLSSPSPGNGWSGKFSCFHSGVRLLSPGEKLVIELFNAE